MARASNDPLDRPTQPHAPCRRHLGTVPVIAATAAITEIWETSVLAIQESADPCPTTRKSLDAPCSFPDPVDTMRQQPRILVSPLQCPFFRSFFRRSGCATCVSKGHNRLSSCAVEQCPFTTDVTCEWNVRQKPMACRPERTCPVNPASRFIAAAHWFHKNSGTESIAQQ